MATAYQERSHECLKIPFLHLDKIKSVSTLKRKAA